MSGRAAKSGLAAESHAKIHSKFDGALASQLLAWIAKVTGEEITATDSMEDFCAVLKDGKVLCALANALKPDSIKKINTSAMAFKQMENINFFLKWVEEEAKVPKNESFMTVDLYEAQDPNSVLVCLGALARRSEKLFGVAGLGPKESEANVRHFTQDQLKAGEGIIGLQAGSNQGATQAGMNIGNTRHL